MADQSVCAVYTFMYDFGLFNNVTSQVIKKLFKIILICFYKNDIIWVGVVKCKN